LAKKLSGISLLLLLVAPPLITFAWLHYQKDRVRHDIKHRIMAGMDRDELVLLSFGREEAESELRWEHSKEFEYDGEMYDVVERSATPDSLHYWCWWDHKETELNRKLAGLVHQALGDDPQQKENHKQLLSYFKTVYLPHTTTEFQAGLLAKAPLNTKYFNAYSYQNEPPATPPPRV
jgi:hypothetical protein